MKKVRLVKLSSDGWEKNWGGVVGKTYECKSFSYNTNPFLISHSNNGDGFYVNEDQVEFLGDDSLTGSEPGYREQALATMNHDHDGIRNRLDNNNIVLLNAALGLSGEAGEFTDKVKKIILHGQTVDREDLIKELGDIRWYLETAMVALNTTLSEVEDKNIAKLKKRYPNGFSTKAAEERVDVHGFNGN